MSRLTLLLALLAALPASADDVPVPRSTSRPDAASLVDVDAERLLAAVRAPGAAVTLVNVWATWCVPCREEFPDLMRLRADYAGRGVRVLFVSGDFDSERPQVEAFLREQGVDFPTYIKTGPDMAFIDAIDPAWNGGLPATFIYDAAGERRQAIHGKSTYAALAERVQRLLFAPKPDANREHNAP